MMDTCRFHEDFNFSHVLLKHATTILQYCNPDAASGLHDIDPDMKGGLAPFKVLCDMTDTGGVGVTVVSHDSEVRERVTGYTGQGTYY